MNFEARPGYRGFLAFWRELGVEIAPHQRTIARAAFAAEREIAAVLPRGNWKSTTCAQLAVHHVLSVLEPSVYIAAGSREQARILGRMVERYARHPRIAGRLIIRHDELRTELGTVLMIVAATASMAHGWERPTLMIGDEVWTWTEREPTMLDAMETALAKNPEARLVLISSAGPTLDSQLGRLRKRAMAGEVARRGARIDAHAPGLTWMEWSVPEHESLDDFAWVRKANPAITTAILREQHERVTPRAWAQLHCGRWGVGEGSWLPPGAWSGCAGEWADPDEPVWLGVDIGGSRAASAVVGVTESLDVAEVHVFEGDEAVLDVTEAVIQIASRRTIVELAYDPWRFRGEALRLQREHGLATVEFPQSRARLTAASEALHAAIVERRLTHPDHPDLNRHVAAATAKATGRGWTLAKSERTAQVDGVISLAMACERAQAKRQPTELIGWL